MLNLPLLHSQRQIIQVSVADSKGKPAALCLEAGLVLLFTYSLFYPLYYIVMKHACGTDYMAADATKNLQILRKRGKE